MWNDQDRELSILTPSNFSFSDISICSPLIVMFGGSSITLLAVYLVARNMALDLEVFFFISLSSHQSKNFLDLYLGELLLKTDRYLMCAGCHHLQISSKGNV